MNILEWCMPTIKLHSDDRGLIPLSVSLTNLSAPLSGPCIRSSAQGNTWERCECTCIPRTGFELAIPVCEEEKRYLGRAAAVTAVVFFYLITDWLAGWLTDWLTDWLTGWLTDWLTGWLAGWLTGWLTDWLADWLAGWLTGWLAGWLTDWLAGLLTDELRD